MWSRDRHAERLDQPPPGGTSPRWSEAWTSRIQGRTATAEEQILGSVGAILGLMAEFQEL